MHALSYSKSPQKMLNEAARLLRKGGRLVVATLNAHQYEEAMRAYDHVNLGLAPDNLRRMLKTAGLEVEQCGVTSREPRPPYFEVVTALARKR
jgi:ArsR family transcriptional regulator